MPPLFFGSSTQQLYGVLEAPQGRPRSAGVLLLYPGLPEYNRSHWAFRSLAAALTSRGFPVLRFDYRGMGDSAGEPEDATFEAWVEDAGVAARELKDSTGVQHVVPVGLRLGAAVAVAAGRSLGFVRRMVLWNPVVTGSAWLEELEVIDQSMRLRELHPPQRPADELAGYRMSARVRASLQRVDLKGSAASAPRKVDIFSGVVTPELTGLRAALSAQGDTVEAHSTGEGIGPPILPDVQMMAQEAVAVIAARLAEQEP